MSLKKKISALILTATVGVSGLIGYNAMNPSKPNYTDDSKTNVNRQMEHILKISKEPHTIFDSDKEAQDEVRDYLISELNELGVKTKTYKYDNVHLKNHEAYGENATEKVDLENIYGELKGKSDSYILLCTHYDSAGAKEGRYSQSEGSLGSADAGYALSTILETLRVIKESNVELENGIKILFTDGEECGLLGAKESVKEKEIFDGVNYVINIEARGTSGPAIMFETSQNNKAVLDLYEATDKPYSYSITPEIYRLLPNGTDFTVFLENNLTGINISVLDGLENYHTPNDNPDNLSDKSMQHYGDQVLPIVKEFVSNEKYSNPDVFESKEDSIFFTLGNQFIRYSKNTNMVLLALIALSILFAIKKLNITNIKKILKYIGINSLYTLVTVGLGYGLSRLLALINGRKFEITYLPLIKFEDVIFIIVMIALFVGYFLIVKKFTNNFKENNEFTVSSLIGLFILSLVLTFALPGASYLTVFPAIMLSIALFIKIYLVDVRNIGYIMLLPIALIVMLYVPTIYLFNCALTMGALCVNVFFAMIAYTAIMIGLINMKELF